jgi:signal transduction histidine kinase
MLEKDEQDKSIKYYLYGKIVLAVATVFSILLFYFFMARQTDRQLRNNLLLEARAIVSTIDLNQIKAVSGEKSEENSIAYLKLKNHFINIGNVYKKSVNIYLMGRKPDGTVSFLLDDLPLDSGNRRLPGQIYKNPPPGVLNAFEQEKAAVIGPVAGDGGTVITALAPVFDHQGGNLVALLGMDIDSADWDKNVFKKVVPLAGLFALLVISLTAVYITAYQRRVLVSQRLLLVPLMLILIILLVGFCIVLLKNQANNLNQLTQEKVFKIYSEFNHLLARQSDNIVMMEELILDRKKALRNAVKAGNKESLLKSYTPLFGKLKENFGITHFYFHRPDGVCLLRIHNPAKNGDVINRFTLKEAMRTGRIVRGVELGRFGTLTLRVVKPIFDGNAIIGYLELGKEVDDILSILQSKYPVKLTVTVYKKELNRKDWEIGMKKILGRNADWNRYKDEVIISSSFRKFPAACDDLIKNKQTYYLVDEEVEFDNKYWKAMLLPFIDVAGNDIGNLIILKDVSDTTLIFKQLFILVVGCAIWILIVAFLYTILRHADRNIMKQQMELAKNAEKNAAQQSRIETANNILHDVGNAIAGVSSFVLKPQTEKKWQEIQSLYQLRDLFEANEAKIIKALGKEKQKALDDFMKALISSFEGRYTKHLEFLEKISAAVNHVCSVLNLQRRYLAEGDLAPETNINLPDIINDTLVMLSENLNKRNIKVSFDVKGKNLNISGDKTGLIRVFVNIIKNSCEAFDETKSVKDGRKLEISVTLHEDRKEIEIIFSDNGIGFTPETGEKLFERGFTSKLKGSGIGLHECRLAIESHGGTIIMKSNGINTGTSTIITFPIKIKEG